MGMAGLYPDNPRMVVLWIGSAHQVMIYSAGLAETIFTNSNNFNKGMFYDHLFPWLGNSLLLRFFKALDYSLFKFFFRKTEEWRPRRKLLTPTFHYEILRNFVHVFNHQSEVLIKQLHKHIEAK